MPRALPFMMASKAAAHGGDSPGQRRRWNVFLGFISAVAFATILAVVSGLTLSGAQLVSHDLYATVFKKFGRFGFPSCAFRDQRPFASASLRIYLGLLSRRRTCLHGMLAFADCLFSQLSSALMSVLWKNCTTKGAVGRRFCSV